MDETEDISRIRKGIHSRPGTPLVWLVLGVVLLILLFCAWPRSEAPLRYPDSFLYIHWPTASYGPDQPVIPSRRPPGYPLTLRVLGTGEALMVAQTLFSFCGFALLGWSLARVFGVLVLGGLALAPALAPWNEAILSESASLACLAWLFFLSFEIAKSGKSPNPSGWAGEWMPPTTTNRGSKATLPLVLLWGLVAVYFVLLRDTNGLILPLLGLCFLRLGKGPLALALLFVAALILGNTLQADREGRYQVPYATALLTRTLSQPGELERLREQGMPRYEMPVSEAMRDWFDQGGRRIYESWVITQPASYTVFLPYLNAPGVGEIFHETYFPRKYRAGPGQSVAGLVWQGLSLPFVLFLGLLAVPWIDYRLRGRISIPAMTAALLVPATYGIGFVTYHAAGSEEYRHMLMALLLYRLAFVFGGWALLMAGMARFRAFHRGPEPRLSA
ncbi:MAG: hypothetical protein VX252_09635 [Myxococcota bacterium]|nr:hypothetical protein [Myxococcota bacterium]